MERDVLIFGGQSNMQGQTECCPAENEPVKGTLEYRFLTDSLIPVAHPIGEDIGDGLLLGAANEGHGSLVPDFCRTYVEKTGRSVIAIHAARGDTQLSEWLKGTPRYTCALQKIRAGLKKAAEIGTIGHVYYIWLQGESDAIKRTPEDTYIERLIAYKNDLKQDIGIERFGLIEIGYFCSNVAWLTDRTKEDALACDETIMRAQERLPAIDSDFVMLTQICKKLSVDPACINPDADGHYNNKAMTEIGKAAAETLAAL